MLFCCFSYYIYLGGCDFYFGEVLLFRFINLLIFLVLFSIEGVLFYLFMNCFISNVILFCLSIVLFVGIFYFFFVTN